VLKQLNGTNIRPEKLVVLKTYALILIFDRSNKRIAEFEASALA
jgi:hypothetical protein